MNTLAAIGRAWPFLLAALALLGTFGATLYRAGARRPGGASRAQNLLLLLAAPLAAGALYVALGEPRALDATTHAPHAAKGTLEHAVQELAARLAREPGDTDGWVMLAQSYSALGRPEDAAAAYEHIAERALQNTALLTDWIEARLLAADMGFDARTHELVARAAALAPADPAVLQLRALAALDQGDFPAAAAALTALREQTPPDAPEREALDTALARLARGEDPRADPSPSAAAR